MNILYLFSGTRSDKFKGIIGVDFPDTQFYGINHLGKFSIDAEYKEIKDVPVLRSVGAFLPFGLRHALMTLYFSLKGEYDIIFGSSLMYGLFFKKILRLKQKFVILDISLGRTLTTNQANPLKYKMIRWLLGGANAVVSLSSTQQQQLEQRVPALAGKTFFVHLGVDVAYHKPVFSNRTKYILSAGRDNGRDYKTVLETARLMPNEHFEIVCSARNLVSAGAIPPNVTVHIDLPHTELCVKFGQAEMLLLTTHADNHSDGSDCSGQTVLLEAMANGLPVIASRKKYLGDYVTEGVDVLGVDCYDAQGIVKAVALMRDGDTALRIAQHARLTVEHELSTEKMAGELARIFKTI